MSYVALIPAAGAGARMSAGTPKQYLPLAGRPMLYHAIRCVAVPPVATVFVVLAPDDVLYAAQFSDADWGEFKGHVEPLYCGAATRRESVRNGLVAAMAAVDPDDWVLVHDAARPCLPRDDLARLIGEVSGDPVGGLLALPVAETVKRAAREADGAVRVVASEDRDLLWLAQTPQMFRAGLLGEALRSAPAGVTDEAGAIEHLGLRPKLVAGSRRNLKVTFEEDLAIAESLLEQWKGTST